ncbi:MAG: pentapeptide repeat-containing protein [Bryobacterales bacterium]|nr:pentapeptide repeat-containing protein [Bryobacterales bacterium]
MAKKNSQTLVAGGPDTPHAFWVICGIALAILAGAAYFASLQGCGISNLQNEIIRTGVQLAGVIVGLYVLSLHFRRVKAAEDQIENARDQLKQAHEKQSEESFFEALKLLADERVSIRLGGVDTLVGLAERHERLFEKTVKVLAAQVRAYKPPADAEHEKEGEAASGEANPKRADNEDLDQILKFLVRLSSDRKGRYINIRNAQLIGFHLGGTQQQPWKMTGFDFRDTHFRGGQLGHVHFGGAIIGGTRFDGANLREVSFLNVQADQESEDASISNVVFSNTLFEDCQISHQKWKRCDFTRVILRCTDSQKKVHLENITFDNCNLKALDAKGSSWHDVNLEAAKTDLSDKSNLSCCHFTKCNFQNADLSGADLSHSEFIETRVDNVSFDGANLKGADLRGAKGLTSGQIANSEGDRLTQLPPGIERPEKWDKDSGKPSTPSTPT